MGFQNIVDAEGIGLAATGLTIVFAALVLVSMFIAALPRLLPLVNSIMPEVERHHGAPSPSVSTPSKAATDDEIVAAIGFVLHLQRSE